MSSHSGSTESWVGMARAQFHDFMGLLDQFFFTPSVPYTLAAIRIMGGLTVLYINFCFTFGLGQYVSPDAWISQPIMEMLRSEVTEYPALPIGWIADPNDPPPVYRGMHTFSIFYHVTDMQCIWLVHGAILLATFMLTIGLWTRFAAVAAWIGALSYIQRAQTSLFGLDTLTSILLFYMCLGPCGAVWSVDSWLAARRAKRLGLPVPVPREEPAATFVQRLMQIHFVIIYVGAGTSKLMGASWWGGTAIWGVLANVSFAPLEYDGYYSGLLFLTRHRWLWEIVMSFSTVFTLLVELGLPFMVWFPRTRWIWMTGSLLLHTGIAFLMGLTSFGIVMAVLLFSFVPSNKTHLMWDHLRGRDATSS
ncbi:MAG: hypothetical protein ACOYNP_01460 [Gemmataceae bacterium]|jgi:hypothetical protein